MHQLCTRKSIVKLLHDFIGVSTRLQSECQNHAWPLINEGWTRVLQTTPFVIER